MSLRYFANAAATSLTSSCSSGSTTIEVASVAGLPIQYPFTLIIDRGQATEEVVSVTNASGLSLTVSRGIDSTTAFAHAIGAAVVHGISAQDPREANAHVNATAGVHGVAGSLVGTTDVQTITQKTLGSSNTLNGFTASKMMVSDGAGKLVAGSSAIPAGTVVGTTDVQTLTGKTIDAASNTLVGVVTLTGVQTLTNKTLTSPIVTGLTLDTVNVSAQYETPTCTLVNWTLGNGTLVTRSKLIGKTWFFTISYTAGSTSAFSSTFLLDLPAGLVPKQTPELGFPVAGTVWAQDASGPSNLYFFPILNGNSRLQGRDASGNALNAATFPWATGDRIVFAGSLEIT